MTYTIDLDPITQKVLEADAAAHGVPANEWAATLLRDAIYIAQAKHLAEGKETRKAALEEARRLAGEYSRGNGSVSVDMISREAIYKGER